MGISRPVEIQIGDYAVTLYDLGGAEGFRGVWAQFYSEVRP